MEEEIKHKQAAKSFDRLLTIMDTLRQQCPWDKKQTFDSLRTLTIEETYELSDAIAEKDYDEIKQEAGDVLLHLVFYAKLGSEENRFDIIDIIDYLCQKLIRRHPHIYGDTKVQTAQDVKDNWEQIKLTEGRKSVLGGVPSSLPALIKAYRIQDKAKGVGFDWEKKSDVWDKVSEEINELKKAESEQNPKEIEQEFGDVLFALINYARFIDVNPENALEKTNKKFIARFQYIEKRLQEEGKSFKGQTLAELDKYWNEAKTKGL